MLYPAELQARDPAILGRSGVPALDIGSRAAILSAAAAPGQRDGRFRAPPGAAAPAGLAGAPGGMADSR